MAVLGDFLGLNQGVQPPMSSGRMMSPLRNNSTALMMAGLGLLGGQNPGQQFGNAMSGMATGMAFDRDRRERIEAAQLRDRRRNSTIEYLRSTGRFGDEELVAAEGSPAVLDQMLRQSFQPAPQRQTATDAAGRLRYLDNQAYVFDDVQQQPQFRTITGNEAAALGLDPNRAYNVDANGKISQIGTGPAPLTVGTIPAGHRLVQTEAGYSMEPIPGSPQAQQQQTVAQQKAQSIADMDIMLDTIEGVRDHPGREAGTGRSAIFNPLAIPGSERTDFLTRVDQLKGQAFLQAFESLKGGGTITEQEGAKAENAIARLNTAQSEEAFVEALDDLKEVVAAGRARALGQPYEPAKGEWVTLPNGVRIREK